MISRYATDSLGGFEMRKLLHIALILAAIVNGYYLYQGIFDPPRDFYELGQYKMRYAISGFILLLLQIIQSQTRRKSNAKNKTN